LTVPVPEHHQRYAALIRADRTIMLTSYLRSLEAMGSPIVGDPRLRDLAVAAASEIIDEVVESVVGAEVQIDDRREPPAWATARGAGCKGCLGPADWLCAAGVLSNIVLTSLTRHVGDDQEFLPCFTAAVLTLNEGVNRRIQEATSAYTGSLLDRLHRAQVDERCRIARELHDRLGETLSVGLRRLDLQEITGSDDSPGPAGIAREVLSEAALRLRRVTSDLREEPVTSLEKALIQYIDSAAAAADVRLQVNGDEAWAPPVVLDETFLIIREATRNALTHGAPRLVLICVDLAPHELRASVDDDGRGFVPAQRAGRAVAGTGLASMLERAVMMRGRLNVSSVPGRGTRIELIVSLPGRRGE
jgi:signal transduction histidine kinase